MSLVQGNITVIVNIGCVRFAGIEVKCTAAIFFLTVDLEYQANTQAKIFAFILFRVESETLLELTNV